HDQPELHRSYHRHVLRTRACKPLTDVNATVLIGTLIDDLGTIAWSDGPDPLPLPATPTRRGLTLLPPQTHLADLPSFDSGAQPVPELFSRPDADEKSPSVSPQSEKQEHEPLTIEEENEN
ncbi:hypothetical protein ACWCYZ_36295, partial [Streptomyces virginiae]